jgi:hypothetical protein
MSHGISQSKKDKNTLICGKIKLDLRLKMNTAAYSFAAPETKSFIK